MKAIPILAHVPSMYINIILAGDLSIAVLCPGINVFYEANARSFLAWGRMLSRSIRHISVWWLNLI
jgi:hypothetical protein